MLSSAKKLLFTLMIAGLGGTLIASEGTTTTSRDKICQLNDSGRFTILEVLIDEPNYLELYKVLLRYCNGDSHQTSPDLQTPASGEFSGGS